MNIKIPVTILTGFLGSGKTTLLNRILREEHGLRIAIIENEYGEIGIDQDLIVKADKNVVEMNNGCMCCQLSGSLVDTLINFAKRKDDFDRLIIETTGVANPLPILKHFYSNWILQESYELDGIITLVDSKHVVPHLENDSFEVLVQISAANRILLNKTDLVNSDQVKSLKNQLAVFNSEAELISTNMANAPIAHILNVGGVDLENVTDRSLQVISPEYPFEWAGLWKLPPQKYTLTFEKGPSATIRLLLIETSEKAKHDISIASKEIIDTFTKPPQKIGHSDSIKAQDRCYEFEFGHHDSNHVTYDKTDDAPFVLYSEHSPCEFKLSLIDNAGNQLIPTKKQSFTREREHLKGVSSVSIEIPGLLDKLLFGMWYERFLNANAKTLYRVKGVIGFKGEDYRSIFQGVHSLFDTTPGENWGIESPVNRMVFIGKGLNEEDIKSTLEYCLSAG